MCGTPAFMAPEQHHLPRRSRGYSLPVDVWATGVTMYMVMFGGKHPFLNARGSLNEKALLNGDLDFRKPGFFGSLGIRSMHMTEEARRTCQLLAEVEPSRRGTGKGLLERPWFSQARSTPMSRSSTHKSDGEAEGNSGYPPGPPTTSKRERIQRTLERLPGKLEEVGKRVSAKFSREEEDNEPAATTTSSGRSDAPQWEFGVRDGFCSYQADSSDVLEEQFQAFRSGSGPPQGTVISMGREVVVDFEGMHQRVKGSTGRVRPVRRSEPSADDSLAI